MTVKELTDKLNKFPMDAKIRITTGELFLEKDVRITADLNEDGTVLDMEIF